ncbi:hypothetical protein QYE76_018926 [Lolium multiflorum]|uniref:AP2/ERF domain-containing protein n=1 Tax=Lolium multiflorum TaxID=4521 RepID=A0AAD8VE10_LOLMU|nr:hypothetical protein QYE76_018926 [Lolium multiflorum]
MTRATALKHEEKGNGVGKNWPRPAPFKRTDKLLAFNALALKTSGGLAGTSARKVRRSINSSHKAAASRPHKYWPEKANRALSRSLAADAGCARAKNFTARALSRYPAREICRVRYARHKEDTREAANCHSSHVFLPRLSLPPLSLPRRSASGRSSSTRRCRRAALILRLPRRPRAASGGRRRDSLRRGADRLGTYDTAHEAARAYDAVAWRLGRPAPDELRRRVDARARRCSRRHRRSSRTSSGAAPRPRSAARGGAGRAQPPCVGARVPGGRRRHGGLLRGEGGEKARAAMKASREKRRADSARKKARADAAARRKEERQKAAGPSTVVLSSSSEFQYTTTSTPVSDTTLSSSDFDWESDDGEE